MGQRSQIYIRISDNYNEKPTLIAKYFQWNFAERMISRARHGIEYIKSSAKYLSSDTVKERINRIFDVNFDMKDVALSTDILKEWVEYSSKYYELNEINDYIFHAQDNNDGKLFIDVDEKGNVKYCFTDYDMQILSPEKYMDWDFENWQQSEYLDREDAEICINNINYILENAKQMTGAELEEFISFDYSEQIKNLAKKLNIEIESTSKVIEAESINNNELENCEVKM